jgi:hypothetical protein
LRSSVAHPSVVGRESPKLRSPYLPLAAGNGDVDETPGVQLALVGAALGDLGLLLGLNLEAGARDVNRDDSPGSRIVDVDAKSYLGGLRLDLACAHLLALLLILAQRMRRRILGQGLTSAGKGTVDFAHIENAILVFVE